VELQAILQEIKKLHNAYPLPEGDLATPVKSVANTSDCILDTPRKHDEPALLNTRIPQNPRKIRKKKKKQILPPCPPKTLEPEKTDQTQRLQNVYSLPKGNLATPVKSAANPMTGRKKMKAKCYPKPSPPQLDPQSRNAPSPAPQPQPAQTDKAWHPPPTSETPTPRRGAVDCVRSADSAPAKTDQIRPPITSETPTPWRAAFDFVRSADSAPAKTDQIRPPTTSETPTPRRAAFDFVRSADSAPAKTDTPPPPPPPAKLQHHGELLLTSFSQQTQRPQRRIPHHHHHHHHQRNSNTTESCFRLRSVSRLSARKDGYPATTSETPTPRRPPNAHIGTDTKQMVHSIEACYIAPLKKKLF
jgi:hypothetical protein